jgi:hypothetical protein
MVEQISIELIETNQIKPGSHSRDQRLIVRVKTGKKISHSFSIFEQLSNGRHCCHEGLHLFEVVGD